MRQSYNALIEKKTYKSHSSALHPLPTSRFLDKRYSSFLNQNKLRSNFLRFNGRSQVVYLYPAFFELAYLP